MVCTAENILNRWLYVLLIPVDLAVIAEDLSGPGCEITYTAEIPMGQFPFALQV